MDRVLAAIEQIQTFGELDGRTQVEAIVYAYTEFGELPGVQPSHIKAIYDALHLAPYSRIGQYLSEASKKTRAKKPRFLSSKSGYRLEAAVRSQVIELFPGRPTKRLVQQHLTNLLDKLPSGEAKAYLSEAIGCFTHDFWRASVVMSWCLVYDLLRASLFKTHLTALNAKLATRKTPLSVSALEDFETIGERDLLDTARAAGLLGKELHKTLVQLLEDRNSYAHPSGKPITASIAEAYIERAVLQAVAKIR